jgi:hypothetical protein
MTLDRMAQTKNIRVEAVADGVMYFISDGFTGSLSKVVILLYAVKISLFKASTDRWLHPPT